MSGTHRDAIRTARSVVVKIGTTALTTESGLFDAGRLAQLADAIESRMKAGSDVVIVSGAIAAGIEPSASPGGPTDLATKQAAASVGQVALVNAWSSAFGRYHRTVGQVLLTAHDISMDGCSTPTPSARRTGCARCTRSPSSTRTTRWPPTRFGSATTTGFGAGRPPGRRGRAGAVVRHRRALRLRPRKGMRGSSPRSAVRTTSTAWWRAGQPARHRRDGVEAVPALLAADAGVPVLLAAATDAGAARSATPRSAPCSPRARPDVGAPVLVRYAAEAAGALTLDAGAVRAVVKQRRSLLPAGVTAVSGRFFGGDVVEPVRTR